MYMEAMTVLTIIHMQGSPLPPISTHIYIRINWDTLNARDQNWTAKCRIQGTTI